VPAPARTAMVTILRIMRVSLKTRWRPSAAGQDVELDDDLVLDRAVPHGIADAEGLARDVEAAAERGGCAAPAHRDRHGQRLRLALQRQRAGGVEARRRHRLDRSGAEGATWVRGGVEPGLF